MKCNALASAHIVSDAMEFMSGSRIHVDQLQITLYTAVFSTHSEAAVPHIRIHMRCQTPAGEDEEGEEEYRTR